MAGNLAEAQQTFAQALGYKYQYQDYHINNPSVTETGMNPGNTLDQLHRQVQGAEAWLSSNGYGDAANILASEDAATAGTWVQAHPDMGVANSAGGTSTGILSGAGGSGSGTGTVASSGTSGFWGTVGADTQSFISGLGAMLNGVGAAIANPASWLGGVGTGLANVGQGAGAGAQAAGTGAGSGLWSLAVPAGIILGALWLEKRVRVNYTRNKKTTTEGRPLI